MYFKSFDNIDPILYNVEDIKLNNKNEHYIILNNEKKKISYYLKSSCYIDLNQFYKKYNLLKKELNFKIIKTNVYFDESIDDNIIELEFITQGILFSLSTIKNINYNINKNFNLYQKSKILKINNFNSIIKEKIDIYLNDYDIYTKKIIEWYEDNINGIGEEELKKRPSSPDNVYNIYSLSLEDFINKLMIKINKKIVKSKYKLIFEINPLLIIENSYFNLEWYISKVIIIENIEKK